MGRLHHKHIPSDDLGECACCAAKNDPAKKAAIEARDREWIEKYGFLIHYVPGPDDWINAHTHGLAESMGHADLQIVFPLRPEQAASFFHGVVDKIRAGAKYKAGDVEMGVLLDKHERPIPLEFSDATECDRPVLRVLIPDQFGRAPSDPACQEAFRRQAKARVD